MALGFNTKPVASLKAKQFDSTDMHTFNGVTTANITPENAAIQINKLLNIGGLSIVADENMSRIITEEVVNNV